MDLRARRQQQRLEWVLSAMTHSVMRKWRKVVRHADKLIEPFPVDRGKVVYLVTLSGRTYWVLGFERSYPMDIQRAIELYEKKSFDNMRLEYLTPDSLEEADWGEVFHTQTNVGGYPAQLIDVVYVTDPYVVIHST